MIFPTQMRCLSVCTYILFLICISTPAFSDVRLIQYDKTTKILELLILKDTALSQKWDKYLKELTEFDSHEYQLALQKLKSDFEQSNTDLEASISNVEQECKQASESWVVDLKEKFGAEYTRKELKSIVFVKRAIIASSYFIPYEKQVKETLYREYRYLDAVKVYVQYFLEFSETLTSEEKNTLADRIINAKNYLSKFNYPYQNIWTMEGLNAALYSNALKTRKDINPAVIDFITHHPGFKNYCFTLKASKALNSLK